jgi:hypothetical protein
LVGLVTILLSALTPGGAVSALLPGLLFLGPALLLAVLLFARCYPGEDAIARWRAGRRAPDARRSLLVPRLRPRLLTALGGGRLIGASLADRAPPLPAGC